MLVRQKNILDYQAASQFAQSQGITSKSQYAKWIAAEHPEGMPSLPRQRYEGDWKGWGEFLGTGREQDNKLAEKYLPFEEARAYIHSLKLKTEGEFDIWVRSDARPSFIPIKARRFYYTQNRGWTSMSDFLGNGNEKVQWMDVQSAQTLIRSMHLLNAREFQAWAASSDRPKNFPSHPDVAYKDLGWNGWPEFLGVRRKTSYGELRIAHILEAVGIDFKHQFSLPGTGALRVDFAVLKEGSVVAVIEHHGVQHYESVPYWGGDEGLARTQASDEAKKQAAIAIGAKYINTNYREVRNIYERLRDELSDIGGVWPTVEKMRENLPDLAKWMTYDEAKSIASSMKFANQNEFFKWVKIACVSGLPKVPPTSYKNHGWKGWGDFLGTGNIAVTQKPFVDYETCRHWFQQQGIRSDTHWRQVRLEIRPPEIPSNPSTTYKGKGWTTWMDFLAPLTVQAA